MIKNRTTRTIINPNTPKNIVNGSHNKQKHHNHEIFIIPISLSIQSNAVINRGHPPINIFILLLLII